MFSLARTFLRTAPSSNTSAAPLTTQAKGSSATYTGKRVSWAKRPIQSLQSRTATSEHYTPAHDVGNQFRWRYFDRPTDGIYDRPHRVRESIPNLDTANLHGLRQTRSQVPPP